MPKTLHPKIEAFRKNLGYLPSYKGGVAKQPESIRESNSSNSNGRLLKQYFCIWGVPDDYGTVPVKGCFSKSLNERGPNTNATYKITALWQHRLQDPLGVPSVLIEDEIGLYGEVTPDEGVQVCDECVIRVRSGTVNNGSYGFNYNWDKMEYDEKRDLIIMKECELLEVSFVTIGSQKETYGVRSSNGLSDTAIVDDTESFINSLPRKYQIEARSLISRHIALSNFKPDNSTLETRKPKKQNVLDYDFLTTNFTLK